jgi:phage anti-repressor protein
MDDKQNIGELIPIREKNGKRAVSARSLHAFLENKRQFVDWIKQRIEQYQFVENQDYQVFHNFVKNPNGGRPQDEYAISIEMAKELSMVENNAKGREARQYFIRCEEIAAKKNKEVDTITSKQINAKISWIRGCKSLLRLNENSTLLLLKQVGDPLGLPTPGYTSSNGILHSASELLKKNGRDITAQKFNEVAVEQGCLVELERPAAHGKVKRFKSITEKGKNFGENQVSPRNPKETQPSWYENKFVELLKMLDL